MLLHPEAERERGLASLGRARQQVRQAYADIDPDLADVLREDADDVINTSVSFDGTWQERGFTSHYGTGVCVCVDLITGLVIDSEVLSSHCHACAPKENASRERNITEEEYNTWKEMHEDSSKAMEPESAQRRWSRSLSWNQLCSTQMLSDGDSAAFKEVVALNP